MNNKELRARLKRLEDERTFWEPFAEKTKSKYLKHGLDKKLDAIDMLIRDCLTAIETAKEREAIVPRHKCGNKKIKPDHIGNN